MPKMGESVAEATILKWLKKEGDSIEVDEPVLEIATDKVDSEVPSPSAGTLSKRMFEEGQVVKVGEVIALIAPVGQQATAPAAAPSQPAASPVASTASVASPAVAKAAPVTSNGHASEPAESISRVSGSGRFYSPLVRNIAREEGISMAELESISGSGANDRVTKQDLLEFISRKKSGSVVSTPTAPSPVSAPVKTPAPAPQVSIPVSGNVEIIEMDRMRKLIAEHMVNSKHTSPHVTSFVEADVTNMVKWREKVKGAFEKKEGEKITFTPLFIEAVCRAIRDFPMINVSVDGNRIIVKKSINIGMAAALPSGNLIVPVIKNADILNLYGLTKTVNDLANRARQNKLKPDEIQDGTFTLTNVG
ncbi:MAG: dihydrolipoamide acetyltransferase family protein, partial [Bacteroidota bacterium]